MNVEKSSRCRYHGHMKAVLLGTGWRAMFYLRIGAALPDLLRIVSICTHSPQRVEELACWHVPVYTALDEALAVEHDLVIVSSGPRDFLSTMLHLKERGERVLSETTFISLSDEEASSLADMAGAVAEQYMYTPLFASILAALPMIGPVDQLYLSGLHNHHAASIARLCLGLGDAMPDEVRTLDFPSRMVRTASRAGLETGLEREDYVRKVRLMRFAHRLFINDFSSNQYHSRLYGKRIEVRGEKGIVTQRGLSLVGDDGLVRDLDFVFHREHVSGNGQLTLSHVTLGQDLVFANPFRQVELNDDEIGIAILLDRLSKGEDCPSMAWGVQDARLGRLL